MTGRRQGQSIKNPKIGRNRVSVHISGATIFALVYVRWAISGLRATSLMQISTVRKNLALQMELHIKLWHYIYKKKGVTRKNVPV